MFAIVQAGGRQEKVIPGTVVIVDHVDVEPGAAFTFDQVLLVEQADGAVVVGAPFVKGATVTGVVEAQTQGKKVRVFNNTMRDFLARDRDLPAHVDRGVGAVAGEDHGARAVGPEFRDQSLFRSACGAIGRAKTFREIELSRVVGQVR
mgnify:CR=1 FL=1